MNDVFTFTSDAGTDRKKFKNVIFAWSKNYLARQHSLEKDAYSIHIFTVIETEWGR